MSFNMNKKYLTIIIGIIAVVLMGGGVWYF